MQRAMSLTLVMALAAGQASSRSEARSPGPVAKGARVLSLDVHQAEDGDYDAAFALAKSAGVQAVTLALDWSTVEPTAGQLDPTLPDIANLYYPSRGARLGLSIRPVSTTYRPLPADLVGLPLGDPAVISRFNALLDFLHAHLPDVTFTGIYIGSEHDVYFGTDPASWADWQVFFDAVRPHAKALWPTVPIGTELTYDGLVGPAATFTRSANLATDVVVVSYYPLGANFKVLPPSTVRRAFDAITSAYASRAIHFNQLGYPSSATNGSSKKKQRQFVAQAFAAWDAHAAQVSVVNFAWQTDLSPQAVDAFQDLYGLHDHAFAEFLGTLGLRTYTGPGGDKPAWAAFKQQAALRGW